MNNPAQMEPHEASGIIGLSSVGFIADSNSAYWTEILRGLRDAAGRAGVRLMLLDENSANGWDKVDGLITCAWGATETGARLGPSQPVVSILVDVPTVPSVVVDDFSGGKLAADHLISLGHRRIGVLRGTDESVMPKRMAGYHQALREAGITFEKSWERMLTGLYRAAPEFTRAGAEAMTLWLQEGWKQSGCTALICQNDGVAMGAITALRRVGQSVPADVSVVGYDGTDLCEVCMPPLTTIKLPLYEIGASGIELVLRLQEGPVSSDHLVLPVQLVVRESTAPV